MKVGKKTPLTLKHFEDFAEKLATREDAERSWTMTCQHAEGRPHLTHSHFARAPVPGAMRPNA